MVLYVGPRKELFGSYVKRQEALSQRRQFKEDMSCKCKFLCCYGAKLQQITKALVYTNLSESSSNWLTHWLIWDNEYTYVICLINV
jgi:hypothetical protein